MGLFTPQVIVQPHIYLLGASNGCDSLVVLDLTINTVNVGVIATGPIVAADATGAVYQWLDCNNNYARI